MAQETISSSQEPPRAPRRASSRKVAVEIDDLTYDNIVHPKPQVDKPAKHDGTQTVVVDNHEAVGIVNNQDIPVTTEARNTGSVHVTGVKPLSALTVSFMVSLMVGVVLFLCMVLVVIAVDKLGIISMVNALMGAAAHYDVPRLIMLSGVLAVVYVVGATLMRFLKLMMVNASGKMLGAVTILTSDK